MNLTDLLPKRRNLRNDENAYIYTSSIVSICYTLTAIGFFISSAYMFVTSKSDGDSVLGAICGIGGILATAGAISNSQGIYDSMETAAVDSIVYESAKNVPIEEQDLEIVE
ncbi:hypothetical protein HN924_01950 [Candidatus Woesearchaeota archaeon]|jgi:hypothetical protein|nr:hypothetical protein [Candidatus Woesearchaeota archaeon]MBT7062711.1 hypothetical protein [Candidatus Woesearchaeota archaeon]MBT7402865.1 hypothetical protein [Candidatus Woesearchaeota archaeon]